MTNSTHGFDGQTCMFCPNDIRRKWANKIVRKYYKTEKESELFSLIINAKSDDDIPQEVKDLVSDAPELQLYVDKFIEIAYAARSTIETHLLISPVRHIEKFETLLDFDLLRKIIDAGWAIIRYTELDEASLNISLKVGEVPIPHVHFHLNSENEINKEKLLELMERKHFYVSAI
jgi:diadenosine tetraphosphate (Ap4A) HIT family hydrolase